MSVITVVTSIPSLDLLAREGMQLDRFYTTPICSPTRAALMTGRDPMRLGVAYGVIMPGIATACTRMNISCRRASGRGLPDGHGRQVAPGHAQQTYHPNERGFEHFYGTCIQKSVSTAFLQPGRQGFPA